jgi:sirohydrochlorin cobaltochelatase
VLSDDIYAEMRLGRILSMNIPEKTGLILFAHGSRDPQWRLPFEAMLQKAQAEHAGPVALAFLECMQPSLDEAIDALAQAHVTHIRIVPVFLAVGSHVRKDLPELIAQSRDKHPGLFISATAAIGEQPEIQAAIAAFAIAAR